jgi:hypothetical protein
MQIQTQSLNYLNAYNAISTSSTKTNAAITTSSTANTTSSADVVSISSEAQQLLQASQTSSTESSASKYVLSADSQYKWLSDACHSDASTAAKYTYEFASNSSNDILYDGDSISNPPLRFAISKEVVTPESVKYFNQMKDQTAAEKMALYNTAKANGASNADIMDMILAYNDAQPEEYRKMTGWGF